MSIPTPPVRVPPSGLTLPHSEEAERATLASVLLSPPSFAELSAVVEAGDFYLDQHAHVWRAYGSLDESGTSIDLRTVQAVLEDVGHFTEIGGLAFLASLDSDLPDLTQSLTYARRVRELSGRRETILLCVRSMSSLAEGHRTKGALSTISSLITSAEKVAERVEVSAEPSGAEVAASAIADLESAGDHYAEHKKPRAGIETGLGTLDRHYLGLPVPGLCVLAAGPGVGKTTLANQIAHYAARSRPVLYLSFENSVQNLSQIAICARAGVVYKDARAGTLGQRGYERIYAAHREMTELGIFDRLRLMEGSPAITTAALRAKALRAADETGEAPLVVVDYAQLWASVASHLRGTEIRPRVDQLTAELIALAKRSGAGVVAISSQSRAGSEGYSKARMSSLKESGSLEYSADLLVFLQASEELGHGDRTRLELVIRKNRMGPTGKVELVADLPRGRFWELEGRYEES